MKRKMERDHLKSVEISCCRERHGDSRVRRDAHRARRHQSPHFVRDQLRRKFLSTPDQIIVERGRSGLMEEP